MSKQIENQVVEEPAIETSKEILVDVTGLKKHYNTSSGIFDQKSQLVRAVDGVNIEIPRGDTFGLVGESGSGKTTFGKTLLHIEEPTEGVVRINGTDISDLSKKELRNFRENIQIVHQDPTSCLNPKKRIKSIISEPLKIHNKGSKDDRVQRVEELLKTVGIPIEYKHKYPTALSGGQKQRVGIARAVALNPDFIVLDEPTSALDVSVQANVIDLLKRLQSKLDLTYLFISHDLSLIQNISDWIGVMYLGKLVEIGTTKSVFTNPQHPYTRALISVIPTVYKEDESLKPSSISVEGEIPDHTEIPNGCKFASRCPKEFEHCTESEPGFYQVSKNHYTRCFLHDTSCKPEGPNW